MSDDMATLIAKRFIQRRDAKAMQKPNGDYVPVADWNPDGTRGALYPFTMADLNAHLNREQTYGHYLIDADDKCKLFAFDIDLEKNRLPSSAEPEGFTGSWCELPDLSAYPEGYDMSNEEYDSLIKTHPFDAREAWLDRAHPSRRWLKYQLRCVGEKLARTVAEEFELPVAMAYSGAKGIHVYAFTGSINAAEAREAAETTMALAGGFELFRGHNFFRTTDRHPFTGFPNLSIEIFPKQGSLEGKDLGNLMRLPLGRNQKTQDPTFFVDQRAPLGQLVPHPDPVSLLKTGRPWL